TIVASRSVTVTFGAVSPALVIQLSTAAAQLPADGVSSTLLQAQANPASGVRKVSFKTTNGSFVHGGSTPVTDQNDLATGSDGVARVQLFAPLDPGTALVTVTANGFSASQTISFTPALPDFLSLRATPLEVSEKTETNTIDLTATLSRAIGTVTRNT